MKLVETSITFDELRSMAEMGFGDLVKAVVDVEREVMVVDGELHSDEEALLLTTGSRPSDLWGINLYPGLSGSDWIQFDSIINVRPSQGNRSRSIDDPEIRRKIITVVESLVGA